MWQRLVVRAWWARLLLAGLLLGLVYRLPAAWVAGLLPASLHCGTVSGSLWQGQCEGLEVDIPGRPESSPAVAVGRIRWSWQAGAVLRGELAALLHWQQGGTQGAARVALRPTGLLRVTGLRWHGPLDATLLPFLPPGLTGRLDTEGLDLELQSGRLASLTGELRVAELVRSAPAALPLGSYRLVFGPPQTPLLSGEAAVAQATLASVPPGPLEAQGEIKLSARGWEVQALLRPTSRSQPALAAILRALGAVDEAGQHQVLLSGSF